MKIELAPNCKKLYDHMIKARIKYRNQFPNAREIDISNSSIDKSGD